ncbi:uncharacterized protein LOC135709658 [Ochlerotatus camptorhynchus]|uniref:uncharacterized protein LOC135709658 n=1 Tax=Ochlerotatus camptorhynchus TaxID=644619 RepID=UPI0031DB10E1
MGDSNLLSAYKLINSQLVLSNQKLKEEIKDKIEMINALNEEVFKYREENKTLRDMVHKLVEQFKTVTTIMVSVRDQSESVFNVVFNEHARKEHEQQTRRPVAGLFYEKRRTECPPYVDEAAIAEGQDENQSMEDYRSAIAEEDDDELGEEDEEQEKGSTPSKSPLVKRLGRKSKNRSFDESFETIDTNRVVKSARKSQEYLQCRDSRDGRHSEDGSIQDSTDREDSNTSKTIMPPIIVVDATLTDRKFEGQSTIRKSILEVSSFSVNSSIPSDQSTQSELNPTTDQSMRPVSMKRMASDSMLTTLVERENNKENSTLVNDTISNAASSTPVVKKCKPKTISKRFTVLSPVPFVSLKPLTKENLSEHNISYDRLVKNAKKVVKYEEPDSCSDQNSIDSNDSRRPRRKAAPKVLKEQRINLKMRRT